MQWMVVLLSVLAVDQVRSWEPSWNTLRVTWGLKLWKDNIFGKMPLTSAYAEKQGYIKVNASAPCSGTFLGHRYYKSGDPSLVVLYDVKGYIAGIQGNYLTRLMTHNMTISWFKQSKMFVQDVIGTEAVYSMTAYFVDTGLLHIVGMHINDGGSLSYYINPWWTNKRAAKICTTGRTQEEFDESNTGTHLFIQNGSSPLNNHIEIPLQEADVAGTAWTKGKCFPSMGVHYWYNLTIDMDCDNFKPMFLLYNRGKLTGFGWAAVGDFQNSNRYEHPPKQAFARFLDPVPTCLNTAFDEVGGFTTMHVFMNAYPWNLLCI